MKANRAARADEAGAEVIGALILFGIFVATIALLNVTAVPSAGLVAEEEHYERTLAALNALQAEAETAGLPENVGGTVARSFDLAPARGVGQDFFSFFLATPARASGEITFEPDYGNLSVRHYREGVPNPYYDIGSATDRLPLGRIRFDPHPVFRGEGGIHLENGGVVIEAGGGESMRYEPPFSVSVSGSTTHLTVKARILNGTATSIGGTAPVRALLTTEAATLTTPPTNNAENVTLTLQTAHGEAWRGYLDRISQAAGLASGTQYYVGLEPGATDTVTWIVNGTASGNDIRLAAGVAVYAVTLS